MCREQISSYRTVWLAMFVFYYYNNFVPLTKYGNLSKFVQFYFNSQLLTFPANFL